MTRIKHNSLDKQYLYHITQNPVPTGKFTWKPRTIGSNRCDFEPRIPRICLSKTISGCFVALGECLLPDKDIYVLKTFRPIHYYSPLLNEVVDAEITDEVWRLKESVLQQIAKLDAEIFHRQEIKLHDYLNYNAGTKEILSWQIIAKSAVDKIMNNIQL